MVKKMSTEEFIAWRNLYTTRLDHLRAVVIQAIFDAKKGHITEQEASETISIINEEVKTIIECGKLLNQLKKGN